MSLPHLPTMGAIIERPEEQATLLSATCARNSQSRAAIGFGRNGTFGGNSSGDIFLAFSTANAKALPQLSPAHLSMEHLNDGACDPIYLAAVQSTEEAVINAMLAAEDAPEVGPDGGVCKAIDHAELLRVMAQYGRVAASRTSG